MLFDYIVITSIKPNIMKTRALSAFAFLLLLLPLSAYALNAPVVDEPPATVDANTYIFTVYVEDGSTVSISGGPAQIAPVTDGAGGDEEDGVVKVEVALAQNQENIFSINASKNGETTPSALLSIIEQSVVPQGSQGDVTPPEAPLLTDLPEMVEAVTYLISGSTETEANINVRLPGGSSIVHSTTANVNGLFSVEVDLIPGKTNRFNISAEDKAGNEGSATQAIISVPVLPEEEMVEMEKESELVEVISFQDTQGHWAEGYIQTLAEQGVVSGKVEGFFDPNANVTRAELIKMATLAFGHSVEDSILDQPFVDVKINSWFAPFVKVAKDLSAIQGYDDGTFRPNDHVNRAEALKIIFNLAQVSLSGTEPDFKDVSDTAWFAPYVAHAQQNDIVAGYDDGTFRPGNKMTRAEVAKVVVKMMNLN